MKRNQNCRTALKRAALALSLGAISFSGVAVADSPYSSPSRWNNFRPALDEALADEASSAGQAAVENLPAPRGVQDSADADLLLDGPANNGNQRQSGYNNNGSAPLAPSGYPMGGYADQSNTTQQQAAPAYGTPTPAAPVTSSNGHVQSYPSAPVQGGTVHQGSVGMPSGTTYSTGGSYSSGAVIGSAPVGGSCGGTGVGGSYAVGGGYQQAMSGPWAGSAPVMGTHVHQGGYGAASCGTAAVRNPLSPYFGSAGLTFWKLEESGPRFVATGLGNDFNTALVDPDASVGFDAGFGRYFGCGKYGAGVNYMLWNPGQEQLTRVGTAGAIRAAMPQYRDVNLNFGTVGSVYDLIDGTSDGGVGLLGAGGIRLTRDLSFQGIEANFYNFGLMGAQRASYLGCGNGGGGFGGLGFGGGRGHGRGWNGGRASAYGFGGAAGPLVRASSGRLRIMNSHGFRWFQIKDSAELAYNIDGTPGYQSEDIYDNVDTENNLFGYQFGSRLTYCVGSRVNLNLGGKFGVYSNRAEVRHRLGTQTQLAYLTASGTDDIYTEEQDTVLATLGELDLGFGVRLTDAWSVNAGYRLMGITGVANAIDSFPQNYSSVAASGEVRADDSYFLHGAYLGAQYNW